MDALEMLRADHRRVKELFRQFEEPDDARTKKQIADEAIAELYVHAQIEEEVFYPAMERQGMKDIVAHAEEEHQAAETLMADLADMDARDAGYEAKFRVLVELVTSHMEDEESQMFPRAAEAGFERLERIGEEITRERARIVSAAPSARRSSRSRTGGSPRKTSATRSSRRTASPSRTAAHKAASTVKAAGGRAKSSANGARKRAGGRTKTRTAKRSPAGSASRGTSGATSRDELDEKAMAAGAEGRSSVSNEELATAPRSG